MARMDMQELSLDMGSGLEISYASPDFGEGWSWILVMSARGTYPDGGAGNDAGDHLAAAAVAGILRWSPAVLVLDFSDLEYRWGSNLLAVLREPAEQLRQGWDRAVVLVVAGERCRDGLCSLLDVAPDEQRSWLVDDLPTALDRARTEAQEL